MEMRTIEALRPKPAPEPIGVVVPVEPQALIYAKVLAETLKKHGDSISDEDMILMCAALETLSVGLPFGPFEFLEWAVERGSGWSDMSDTVRDYAEEKLGMERVETPVRPGKRVRGRPEKPDADSPRAMFNALRQKLEEEGESFEAFVCVNLEQAEREQLSGVLSDYASMND